MRKLKRVIREGGVKQSRIAEVLGVQEATISHWVNGKSDPKAPQLLMLSVFLRVPVQQLIGDVEDK